MAPISGSVRKTERGTSLSLFVSLKVSLNNHIRKTNCLKIEAHSLIYILILMKIETEEFLPYKGDI